MIEVLVLLSERENVLIDYYSVRCQVLQGIGKFRLSSEERGVTSSH
jgi:hypothetical protein